MSLGWMCFYELCNKSFQPITHPQTLWVIAAPPSCMVFTLSDYELATLALGPLFLGSHGLGIHVLLGPLCTHREELPFNSAHSKPIHDKWLPTPILQPPLGTQEQAHSLLIRMGMYARMKVSEGLRVTGCFRETSFS